MLSDVSQVEALKHQLADQGGTAMQDNNAPSRSVSPSTSTRMNRSQSPSRRSPLRGRSEDPQVKRMLERASGSWGW